MKRIFLVTAALSFQLLFQTGIAPQSKAQSGCEYFGQLDQPGTYTLSEPYGSLQAGDSVYYNGEVFRCGYMDYGNTDAGFIPRYMLQ